MQFQEKLTREVHHEKGILPGRNVMVPTDQGKIFKTFSSKGNQGKTVFQPKSGEKFQIRELFLQIIFKPQELSGNGNICID